MERRYLFATVGILLAFAVGLIGYFAFSASSGDGLEKTMENGGLDPHSAYQAPLSYGDGYLGSLVAGIIGFSITLGAVYGYMKLSKRKKERA